MKNILVALLMVALAVPAWGDGKKAASHKTSKATCAYVHEGLNDLLSGSAESKAGNCYYVDTNAPAVRFVSPYRAIYKIWGSHYAMIDFGKNVLPPSIFIGHVKSKGVTKYYDNVYGTMSKVYWLDFVPVDNAGHKKRHTEDFWTITQRQKKENKIAVDQYIEKRRNEQISEQNVKEQLERRYEERQTRDRAEELKNTVPKEIDGGI